MIEIDLQQYHNDISFRVKDGKRYLFDPIRKKEIIVQPEELVRQSWIHYLYSEYNISYAALSVEKTVKVGEMNKRFDLIYNRKAVPEVLFEFKSFNINITEKACRQVASYNLGLTVPYIIISNGIVHFAYKIDHNKKLVRSLDNLSFLSGDLH